MSPVGVCELDEQVIPIRKQKIATTSLAILKFSVRNCCLLPMELALFANGHDVFAYTFLSLQRFDDCCSSFRIKLLPRPRFITVSNSSNSSAQLERRSMGAK